MVRINLMIFYRLELGKYFPSTQVYFHSFSFISRYQVVETWIDSVWSWASLVV